MSPEQPALHKGGRPFLKHRRAHLLGLVGEVDEEARREEGAAGHAPHLAREVAHHRVPARALARELVEHLGRGGEDALGLRERRLERLRLGGALGKVILELLHLGVEVAEGELALVEAVLGVDQVGLQPVVLVLERLNADEHRRVLEVGLDPRGERGGGDGDAMDHRMLKRVAALVEQVLHRRADLGRDLTRVKVEDVILDRRVTEESLHRDPRRVKVAHDLEHPLEDVADLLGRHLERADLIEIVLLDAADGLARRLEHGLDAAQLVLNLHLFERHHPLLLAELLLKVLHLAPLLDGALHRALDLLHRPVRLLLLGGELGALLVGRRREAGHLLLRLGELLQPAAKVLDAVGDLLALLDEEGAPHLCERDVHPRRRVVRATVAKALRESDHLLRDEWPLRRGEELLIQIRHDLGGHRLH